MADLRPRCTAVLIEGQLYLFDTALGLPIPAQGGISVDRNGQLDIQPASLVQVAADDSLLRGSIWTPPGHIGSKRPI